MNAFLILLHAHDSLWRNRELDLRARIDGCRLIMDAMANANRAAFHESVFTSANASAETPEPEPQGRASWSRNVSSLRLNGS